MKVQSIKTNVTPEISIRNGIDSKGVDRILGNGKNKMQFIKNKSLTLPKTSISKEDLNKIIIDNWDYVNDKKIIRSMYFNDKKSSDFELYPQKIEQILEKWYSNFPNETPDWPFRAAGFDQKVASINRSSMTEEEKDAMLTKQVLKFRWMKLINTYRNDYIENKIILMNDNIVPTLGNNRSVDFYIDGIQYDQKVSRGFGGSFIKNSNKSGEELVQFAKQNSALLARSLYENQDSQRFDADYRMYIVFSNEKENLDLYRYDSQLIIKNLDSLDVIFLYDEVEYETKCRILIL